MMEIQRIDSIADFDAVRTDWARVYADDPHAGVFLSRPWLRGWLQSCPLPWFILTVRPTQEDPPVAFLPLSERRIRLKGVPFFKEIQMAGNRIADHTGFLASSEWEEEAVRSLAVYMRDHLKWDRMSLTDVFDPRIHCFLEAFDPRKFSISDQQGVPCPALQLPSDYESYLKDRIAKKPRGNLRRAIKKLEETPEFRMTVASHDDLDAHLATTLSLWQGKWGEHRQSSIETHLGIFRSCAAEDALYAAVAWSGKRPVAVRLGFVDREHRTFSGYISAFDSDFAPIAPGKAMVGHSIRFAIENGLETYDFLRGDEPHKHEFGAKNRFNRDVIITRKGLRGNLLAMKDRRWRQKQIRS